MLAPLGPGGSQRIRIGAHDLLIGNNDPASPVLLRIGPEAMS